MKVKIHNNKYDDVIEFQLQELTEESKQDVLLQVRNRGWKDEDCWSEVEK